MPCFAGFRNGYGIGCFVALAPPESRDCVPPQLGATGRMPNASQTQIEWEPPLKPSFTQF